MRRFLLRGRGKYNQIIPFIIILFSIIFLICLFSLSFSDEIGQAKYKIKTTVVSGLLSDVIESGSGLVGYQVNKNVGLTPFPLNLVSDFYNLHNFVSASTMVPIDNENTRNDANEETLQSASFRFDKLAMNKLSTEYILTNGAVFKDDVYDSYNEAGEFYERSKELPVRIMDGAIDFSEFERGYRGDGETIESIRTYNGTPFTLEQLKDVNFLIRNFYICAGGTVIMDDLFDSELMLEKDMTIKTKNDKPQILIYHTHSQEAFIDSREGLVQDTVVGVGDYLAEVLENKYGYNVIHDRTVYDVVDGKLNRNLAYNYAREGVLKILEENPSIEVIIDLHRDGNEERTIYIKGKETAQIMLFNGLSRNDKGPITRLDNPNLQDNLAFSFQLQLKSLEMYPRIFYKNYLETLRYNLDLRPKSLLLEWGDAANTVESAMNAVEPFAEVLDAVLQGQ